MLDVILKVKSLEALLLENRCGLPELVSISELTKGKGWGHPFSESFQCF